MAITVEQTERVVTVTLNRPQKRNALDDPTIAELAAAFAQADADATSRVVLLRGAGSDFCAGADLAQLEKIARGATPEENLADAMQLGNLLIQMRRMRKPIVAAVHGHAVAGGAGLALACDLVIADHDAVLGFPEVNLGFVPAMVMALLIRTVGEKVAFQLAALGHTIPATAAQRLGIVNEIVTGDFDEAAITYARELAERSATAVQLIKRLLHEIDGVGFETAIAKGAEINVEARSSEDCREGVRRFLEARAR